MQCEPLGYPWVQNISPGCSEAELFPIHSEEPASHFLCVVFAACALSSCWLTCTRARREVLCIKVLLGQHRRLYPIFRKIVLSLQGAGCRITSHASEFLGCFILFDYRSVDPQLVFLLVFHHFSHKHRELSFYFAVFKDTLYINYNYTYTWLYIDYNLVASKISFIQTSKNK